jgi:hypothetical protein
MYVWQSTIISNNGTVLKYNNAMLADYCHYILEGKKIIPVRKSCSKIYQIAFFPEIILFI